MLVRAQITFLMDNSLPEDATVATLWFNPSALSSLSDAAIALQVSRFFTTDVGLGSAIQDFLSPHYASPAQLRLYSMADPEPRSPRFTTDFTIITGGTAIPAEVAVVLSYRSAPESGVPAARRRGRLYIGPLNASAVNSAVTPVRPAADFLNTLAGAAERLMEESAASAPATNWSVWSPTRNEAELVVAGHADDEFDTMRSRGGRRSTRVVFP